MLSDEEKEKIEKEFYYALDNIESKIKGETATAIVISEQSMILLFKRLMLKIEKQSKEIEELKEEKAKRQWVHIKENGEVEPLFYVSEDKIKARIKELEEYLYRGSIKDDFLMIRIKAKIQELQSLLEKE